VQEHDGVLGVGAAPFEHVQPHAVDVDEAALRRELVLDAHALPPPLTIAPSSYAGQPVAPGVRIPLYASGRNQPFAFVVTGGARPLVVAADPLNRVSIAPAP
jgi:hypothetical protein